MRRILILTTFFSLLGTSYSEAGSAGTTGYAFLRTKVGARPSAMGGTFIAVSGDVHNIFYNPAGLADVQVRSGGLTYLKHVLDFHSGFIAYAQPVADKTCAAVAINYINFGTFKRTDSNGLEHGEFGAGSVALTAGVGREMYRDLLAGLTVKYIHSSIDNYSSNAVAFDAGLLYRTPIKDLDVGVGVFNAGFVTSAFIETKDDLPLAYKAGLMKRLEHLPLLLGANIYKFPDDVWQWTVGGEFTVTENLFLRWGYDSIGSDMDVGSGKDNFAGISLGLGFSWRSYRFDYSFSSLGEIGTHNWITFGGAF